MENLDTSYIKPGDVVDIVAKYYRGRGYMKRATLNGIIVKMENGEVIMAAHGTYKLAYHVLEQ